MGIKERLKKYALSGVDLITRHAHAELRDSRNVEIVLAEAMREPGVLSTIRDPAAYVEFLRGCLERAVFDVRRIKAEVSADADSGSSAARRFETLLDQLRQGLPPVEFAAAREAALIADRYRRNSEPIAIGDWTADVGLHFSLSSSSGSKGRILSNVIRFMRTECCLELGTAYGMSALFMMTAMKAVSKSGRLTTVEGLEPQFSFSSAMLKEKYGEMVSCRFGWTNIVLPELAKSLSGVDFMFHDAGHSREDYVRDFGHAVEMLAPGAVAVFDDIRWEDPKFFEGAPRAYDGWREVVAHPRVAQAVEIDDVLGLLLMR
jgi:predicted O-methyltransferase YrrM